MSKFIRTVLSLTILFMFILSSCNLPSATQQVGEPNTVFTQAAQTIEAQLTRSAPFNTPTLPPAPPTNTPISLPTLALASSTPAASPTAICDQAFFIKDVTIPDGTSMSAGDVFKKTWRIKNTGTCTWSGYTLVFDAGEAMNPVIDPIPTVGPGQEVDVSVTFTAPSDAKTYFSYWRIRNASGILLPVIGGDANKSFYVEIKVGDGGSGGPFAVTNVTMSASGSCGNFTITANITTNGAGSVTYKWKRSDGAIDNQAHDPIIFDAAGTQSVSTSWHLGAAGSHWMDIYIDNPNHQQFGRANLSCP